MEVELKLELVNSTASAVESFELLGGDPTIAQQHSIYFDTPEEDLAKAGVSLRIRRSGDSRIQTVKASGPAAAGLFERSEWEQPVDSDTPALDDTTPIPSILGDGVRKVGPRFTVEVERRTWSLQDEAATIEVVLDSGMVLSGKRRAKVCEFELELKDGAVEALFSLARRIDANSPVRLGVLTKAERGQLLLRRTLPKAFKAEPVALPDEPTTAEAFDHIAKNCLRQFRLNEDLLLEDRNPLALHQARVAIRRLRSAFSIYKPMLAADSKSGELVGELRALASELGEARNLDVMLERADPGPLQERLRAEREVAYGKVEHALNSPRVRGAMIDLVEWLHTGEWRRSPSNAHLRDQPARQTAAAALDRLRRRVRKRGKVLEGSDDEFRHDLRKDAKKLRYAAEFFGDLFDEKREKRRRARFLAALEELQDQLGALNDLATAPEVLEKLQLADAPAAAGLSDSHEKNELIKAAAKASGDLAAVKPFWRSASRGSAPAESVDA